jgi:hypothetical protein
MNRLPYLVTVLDKQYHATYYSIRVQHVDGRIEDVRLDANQGALFHVILIGVEYRLHIEYGTLKGVGK